MGKMVRLAWLALLFSASCSKEKENSKKTNPPVPEPATKVAPENPTPAEASRPSASACDFEGDYRVHFSSNNQDAWWFRFQIKGDQATLLRPVSVLSLQPGPLGLLADSKACTLQLTTKNKVVGDLSMKLTLDSKTNAISGTLQRSIASSEAEKNTKVTGVFDGKAPPTHASCFVPGLYQFEFDNSFKWKNTDPDDDRDCSSAAKLASPFVLKLEPFLDTVAVTTHESYPPFEEAWPGATLTKKGDCEYSLKMSNEELNIAATLTLTADGIIGIADKADYQIVEDGEAGEEMWSCEVSAAKLSGKLTPPTPTAP